ncbi:MAG: hypothetical protein EXS05_06590 [Planctomycetaceae bacterium]|nr:hypothetical protein [Planctomycetaceae bacterium]
MSLHKFGRAGLIGLLFAVTHGIRTAAANDLAKEIGDSDEARYGARIDTDGWVHFVVYSPDAAEVSLVLFDQPAATTPVDVVPMKKAGDDWKIRIKGPHVGSGLLYMYRAKGLQQAQTS